MTITAKSIQLVAIFVALSLGMAMSGFAQQNDTGDTGGDAGEATGGTGGAGFNPEAPDMSVFDGIDRDAETTFGTEDTGPGGGGGGFGGGFGGGGLGGLFGGLSQAFGGGNQGGSTQPVIRVRLRSAIDVAPRSPVEVQQSAARALAYSPVRSGVQGVAVTMDGRTAILEGVVRSEKDRRMSELLMRLEPGVRQVDNRVVVQR